MKEIHELRPSAVSLTFAGLRLRCTMPMSCAAVRAFGDLTRDRQCFIQRQRACL
jgi:hypothetical protein